MRDMTIFFSGLFIGGLTMWLWMRSRLAWKSARGLLKAPDKARVEVEKQREKARESVSKGRKEMLWSMLFFVATVFVVAILLAVVYYFL